jgi:hypothetical protein
LLVRPNFRQQGNKCGILLLNRQILPKKFANLALEQGINRQFCVSCTIVRRRNYCGREFSAGYPILIVQTTATLTRLSLARRLVLCVCLPMFILVGTAEAAHSCGILVLHSWQHGKASVEQGFPGGGELCIICVATHLATDSTITSHSAPVFSAAEDILIEGYSAACREGEAALYSRPPPA